MVASSSPQAVAPARTAPRQAVAAAERVTSRLVLLVFMGFLSRLRRAPRDERRCYSDPGGSPGIRAAESRERGPSTQGPAIEVVAQRWGVRVLVWGSCAPYNDEVATPNAAPDLIPMLSRASCPARAPADRCASSSPRADVPTREPAPTHSWQRGLPP